MRREWMAGAAAAEWHSSLGQNPPDQSVPPFRPPFKLGHPPYRGPLGKSVHHSLNDLEYLNEVAEEPESEFEAGVTMEVQSLASPRKPGDVPNHQAGLL